MSLLTELQGFKVLPFPHGWIVLAVRNFGKICSCLKKQTGFDWGNMSGEVCKSFSVQCHK